MLHRRTSGSISSTGSAINPSTGSRQGLQREHVHVAVRRQPWSGGPALERKLRLEAFGSRRKSDMRDGIRMSSTNSEARGIFVSSGMNQVQVFGGRLVANEAVIRGREGQPEIIN